MDLSQFGAAGAIVIVVALFLKYIRQEAEHRDKIIDKITNAVHLNTEAVTKSTAVSQETYRFMKNLNGELKKAAKRKLK